MIRLLVVVVALLGCQDIRQFEDGSGGGGIIGVGGSGGNGGGGGGAGGNGGAGGQGGGGGTPAREIPDQGAGCTGDEVSIEATLRDRGPFTRSDTIVVDYTASSSDIRAASAVGGTAVIRSDRVIFSTNGARPLWSGDYAFRVAAVDGDGCVGEVELDVPLYGDLLAGDGKSNIHFVGSDGVYISLFKALGAPQQVSTIAVRRERSSFIVALLPNGESKLRIVELSQQGELLETYDIQDVRQEDLYPSGGPRALLWDPARELLFGDGGDGGVVHVWSGNGDWEEAIDLADERGRRSLGAAMVGGDPVFARESESRVYRISGALGGFTSEVFATMNDSVLGMGNGLDDSIVVLAKNNQSADYFELTSTGRERNSGPVAAGYPSHWMPFAGDYIGYRNSYGVHRFSPTFELVGEGPFFDRSVFEGFRTIYSIAWLN